MKVIRTIFRIIIGIVFIFSGFVKGVDPLGTVYRMQDYFAVFGIPWANPFALTLTIILCTLEFITGISLLFNLWIKGISWILLPMFTYFTLLTFFDAMYNLVPDCGCFGDAIILTNMQTFLKNLVLMAMVIPVFIWKKKFSGLLPRRVEIWVLTLFVIGFTWMQIHSYRHLPLIDFMGWKTGNQINKTNTQPVKFYVTFKNGKTGEEKEYLAPNYPWNDSVWTKQWTYKSQRVADPNKDNAMVLRVENKNGEDITRDITDNPDFQFILVAYNLTTTQREAFHKILPFYKSALKDGYSFVCLTNSLYDEIARFRMDNGTAFDFYNADDVVLKTMIRSNPGLILIKNGKVLAKWHYHDFPYYDDVMKKFRTTR
ncbi:MAG: DoxX family protein [Bacteroidetes bacterium]|nr:DoxX family protein [Bacteroidota bacterium]